MDTRYIETRLTKHSDRIGVIEYKIDQLLKQIQELNDACNRFEERVESLRNQDRVEKTLSEVG